MKRLITALAMLALSAGGALAQPRTETATPADAPPQPATCKATNSCRFVSMVAVRTGEDEWKAIAPMRWEPVIVDGKVRLYVGEYAIFQLTVGPDGRTVPVFVSSGLASETEIEDLEADLAASRQAMEAAGEGGTAQMSGRARIGRLPANLVRMVFLQPRGSTDTVLIAQNGYGNVLDYHAAITNWGGEPEETSICDVTAGSLVMEHWGWPIFEIELHDLALLTTQTAGPRDCE